MAWQGRRCPGRPHGGAGDCPDVTSSWTLTATAQSGPRPAMPNKDFDASDDERLVEAVRAKRIIYDPEDKDFRNVTFKNAAWVCIARSIGKDSDPCKKRWRDIRDNYNKIMRKLKYPAAPASQKWHLFDKLQFLNAVGREKHHNYPTQEAREESDDEATDMPVEACLDSEPDPVLLPCQVPHEYDTLSVQSSLTNRPFKRHRDQHFRKVKKRHLDLLETLANQRPEDDIDLFMKSIALSVKKLPSHQIWQAKSDILNAVSRLAGQSLPVFPSSSSSVTNFGLSGMNLTPDQ